MLAILDPFFLNMKLLGQTLKKQEFIEALNSYFEILSIVERSIVLNFAKLNMKSESEESSSFSVNIFRKFNSLKYQRRPRY